MEHCHLNGFSAGIFLREILLIIYVIKVACFSTVSLYLFRVTTTAYVIDHNKKDGDVHSTRMHCGTSIEEHA